MNGTMPKKPPKPAKEPKPVLYLRLTDEDESTLQEYIAAQDAPPDRQAVGLAALREFFQRRGYPKPTKS